MFKVYVESVYINFVKMAVSQNITMRLTGEELQLFNSIAKAKGINRSKMIRNAVRNYGNTEEASPGITLQERAAQIIAAGAENANTIKHPLLDRIRSKGIVVHDENGDMVMKIKSLTGLLDFVNTKVFKKHEV